MRMCSITFLLMGIVAVPVCAEEINTSPLNVKVIPAYENLKWTGWSAEDESGQPKALRPILLTSFGDGSNRVVVPTQQGVIHTFPSDASTEATNVFLDIEDRVAYSDKTNEEGFLGLAFHPKYKENGDFFVYYTNKAKKHQNVVSRFKRSANDPSKADPNSEEQLIVFDKPFWNHDGGTICFGPDGHLYIAHGDGGLANDPYGNGQKLNTLLGKILRIDVDHKDPGKNYAIPKDNPFIDSKDARGEIWAYGLRNVWRMAFDPETGLFWAGDVGQDIWEEIDLIEKGGNYGWNLREAKHPFAKSKSPSEARPDLVEPIWEYNHDVGKSITGGFVYRGKRVPELQGGYLYADYVSNKMWALWYDPATKKVTANREIAAPAGVPVMSFGEDESGEAYFTTFSLQGKALYTFAPESSK